MTHQRKSILTWTWVISWILGISVLFFGARREDTFESYWANLVYLAVMVFSFLGVLWVIRRKLPPMIGRKPMLIAIIGLLLLASVMFVNVFWLDDFIRGLL